MIRQLYLYCVELGYIVGCLTQVYEFIQLFMSCVVTEEDAIAIQFMDELLCVAVRYNPSFHS